MLLCSVFVFNFVFLLFPFLHYFVLCICISKFKTFIFRVLLYLYDLRFFPVLFFFYLSRSLIRASSLPTFLSLIVPFFLHRGIPVPNIFLYFFILFRFCYPVFLTIVSNLVIATDTPPTSPHLYTLSHNMRKLIVSI